MRGRASGETRAQMPTGALADAKPTAEGGAWGWQEGAEPVFPLRDFGSAASTPRQELGSGSESPRAGHIAWSLLCPQNGETETHLKPEDRCLWCKAWRWPASWRGSGVATVPPHPEERWHRVWLVWPHIRGSAHERQAGLPGM